MANKSKPSAKDRAWQLGHFKQLRRIAGLLEKLHDCGTQRDRAGNRELHFDDYVLILLFWCFNPALDSMRSLQATFDLPHVQKRLGVRRFSLGSFSESCRVFEPDRLKEIVEQLFGQLQPVARQQLLKDLPGIIELVDGTVLYTLRSVVEAMWLPGTDGKDAHRTHAWKLHLHFDVDHHVPSDWELTDARGEGNSNEKNVLRKRLKSDHVYVMDRGYMQYTLFNDIAAIGSSYVCRVRDGQQETLEERVLSPQDIAAGVIEDRLVQMGQHSKPQAQPDHPIRLVSVRCSPHDKRGKTGGGTSGPPSDGVLRIATNLLDVPAHVIAFLYSYRWTLEVFIRFFKQILGCRHLLSSKRQGIEIQICAAVICCMMINLTTGRKANLAMLRLLHFYLIGWASDEDVLRELNKPDNTGVKLRAKAELWKKLGVNV